MNRGVPQLMHWDQGFLVEGGHGEVGVAREVTAETRALHQSRPFFTGASATMKNWHTSL